MFDAIAQRYDLLNRLLSFGIDRRWRAKAARALKLQGPCEVLDHAAGTGDLALEIARSHPEARVIAADPSVKMLEVARTKIEGAGLTGRIDVMLGSAELLPFNEGRFAGVSMAFGIRNVPDRQRALREMARVTQTGGRVVILELSEPGPGLMGRAARFHVHQLVPAVGSWLSGAREYRYLQQSIARFPPAAEFAALMEQAGLRVLEVQSLCFGVCHLYVAEPARVKTQGSDLA